MSRLLSAPAVDIAIKVVSDPRFTLAPGSSDKHHSYDGGLVQHTYEVMVRSMDGLHFLQSQSEKKVDTEVIFLSSLLHDWGKIHVYSQVKPNVWAKTLDYTKSLHIEKSDEYFWSNVAPVLPHSMERKKHISHCIRAHHGRIDYGSLEEPQTTEAWILHLADMYSAFCVSDFKRRPEVST